MIDFSVTNSNISSLPPTKEHLESSQFTEYFNKLSDGEKYTCIAGLVNNSTFDDNFDYQPLKDFLNKYTTKNMQIYFNVRFCSIFGNLDKYTDDDLKSYITDPVALITEDLFKRLVNAGVTPKEIFSIHPNVLSYATECDENFRLQTLKDVSYNNTEIYLSTKNLRKLYDGFLQKKYLEICNANPLRYIEFPKVYRYKKKFIDAITPYFTLLKDDEYTNIPLHALKNLPFECISHEFVSKLIHVHLIHPKSNDDNIKCIYWGIRTKNNDEKTQIVEYLAANELTEVFIDASLSLNGYGMQFTTICEYAAKINKFTAENYNSLVNANSKFASAVYLRLTRYNKNIKGIDDYWLKFASAYPLMLSMNNMKDYIKDDDMLCKIINEQSYIPNISRVLIKYGKINDRIANIVLAKYPKYFEFFVGSLFKGIKDIEISKETFFKITDKQEAYSRLINNVINSGKLVGVSKDDILLHYLPIQPRDVIPLVSNDASDTVVSAVINYLKGSPYLLQVCGKNIRLLTSPDIYSVLCKCNKEDINEFLANYDIDEIPEDLYLFLSLSYNVRKTIRIE